jgi:chromosome segregation ATPase
MIHESIIDRLESRVRELAEDADGEKRVTRYVLQQARLNGDDLAAMKTHLAHLNDEMVVANAALHSHGVRLNSLTQDVAVLRNETTALRRDMGALQERLEALHTEMNAKFNLVLEAVRALAPRDPPA